MTGDGNFDIGSPLEQLKEILELTPEEIEGIKHSKGRLALAVTPYFVSLMDPDQSQLSHPETSDSPDRGIPSFEK